jgi:tricorn protease
LFKTHQKDEERHVHSIWFKGNIYYISERDYTANIWSYSMKTKQETQITFHKKFDVKNINANSSQIIYAQARFLHLLNPKTKETNQINITVKGDLNYARKRWMNVIGKNLTNPNVSPKGKRAVFEYKGEVFTVPKENGTWRNLANSTGVADRSPVWSPNGDKVAWFFDTSDEYQMVIAAQNGPNQETIKLPNPTFYFKPDWSPDGKHITYTDTNFVI